MHWRLTVWVFHTKLIKWSLPCTGAFATVCKKLSMEMRGSEMRIMSEARQSA